jgi:hypothetical protein
MQDLYDDLVKYKNWMGNREEFLSVLVKLEQINAEECMLSSSKSPFNLLPVNARRIQWFTSKRIIPTAVNRKYYLEHLVYYMHAIMLRKKKPRLTFDQIENQIDNFSFDEVFENLKKAVNQQKDSEIFKASHILEKDEALSSGLKKLGRAEGRPLKSTLLRYALTPWCHVTLNDRHIRDLTAEDADILASAFRKSLNEVVKI